MEPARPKRMRRNLDLQPKITMYTVAEGDCEGHVLDQPLHHVIGQAIAFNSSSIECFAKAVNESATP